jgi:hypothetical protein
VRVRRGVLAGLVHVVLFATPAGFAAASAVEASPPPPPTPTAAPVVPAFGFRSPKEGKPGAALSKREAKRLEEAMSAIRAHDLAKAEKTLRSGAPQSAPYQTALAYVEILRQKWPEARERLRRVGKAEPAYVPALEALADLDLAEGATREALEGYRGILRLVPSDAHAKDRARAALADVVSRRHAEADAALKAKELDAARRIALALMELDPASPAGYEVLSRVAESRGQLEDAYTSAVKARALEPDEPKRTERVAELAEKTRRHADAAALYEKLAAKDPAYRERAHAARLEAQIQTLPEVARRAALSTRLTRAQLAALVVSVVPEVREAPIGASAAVAVDAVGKAERSALVRAIALGFFTVSRETHRVGADTAVTRAELALILQKTAASVARGGKLPACLTADPPLPALEECGILSQSTSRTVGGKEAISAIETAARMGRGGGTPW